ncbi:MAG: hypothetical protein H6828_02745 [Planctomycetes bacterium]|nr:hypothetical protein [Planctomycetota bacterium]
MPCIYVLPRNIETHSVLVGFLVLDARRCGVSIYKMEKGHEREPILVEDMAREITGFMDHEPGATVYEGDTVGVVLAPPFFPPA